MKYVVFILSLLFVNSSAHGVLFSDLVARLPVIAPVQASLDQASRFNQRVEKAQIEQRKRCIKLALGAVVVATGTFLAYKYITR